VKVTKLLLIAAILLAGACGVGENKETAARATGQFRINYEQRKYAAIYAAASPEFQKVTSEAEFGQFLAKIREKLGSTIDVNEGPYNVMFTPSGTVITMNYTTEFQRGEAVETFVWRIAGGSGPQLVAYNINSKQLILN
jgi:hypothetical protein